MRQTNDDAAFGFGGGRPVANRTIHKFRARRFVESGYPWDGAFQTIDEVDAYLSGDRIVCLLCGRALKKLGIHLRRIHGVSDEAYRVRFGIPWRRGLVCEPTKNRLSENARHRMMGRPPAHLAAAREKAHAAPQRERCRAVKKAMSIRITGRAEFMGRPEAEEFLRRLAGGRTVQDVERDPDMPSKTWMHEFRCDNPDFNEKFLATIEGLPFHLQAKMQMLGPRFEAELKTLFDAGLSDHNAAKVLGVTAMSCNKFTKRWRQEGKRQ